jgi:hypothetical protein
MVNRMRNMTAAPLPQGAVPGARPLPVGVTLQVPTAFPGTPIAYRRPRC